jgi:HTH-type transcriptional regulator, sugar sensing transcriptional regulator
MPNSKLTKTLLDIGLSENEAKVYLAALALGPTTILKLSKTANIKRTTAYSVVETIRQKGLISVEIKGWKKLFVVESPDKLKFILNEKRERLEKNLPDLFSIYNLKGDEGFIKYYEGVESVKSIYEDILKRLTSKDWYLVIGNTYPWLKIDPKYFKSFIERRARKNSDLRLLLQESEVAIKYQKSGVSNGKIKTLPKRFSATSNMIILRNKLVLHQLLPTTRAIVIENPSIIQMTKEMFEIMWEVIED